MAFDSEKKKFKLKQRNVWRLNLWRWRRRRRRNSHQETSRTGSAWREKGLITSDLIPSQGENKWEISVGGVAVNHVAGAEETRDL